MAYSILLTSLNEAGKDETVRYFYTRDGHKNYYCDAMLTVEASVKCVLGRYPVDEIITLGRKLTFDEGDDDRLIQLAEGKNFYAAKMEDLSTYSLLRYRLAQYIDELKIEQLDIMDRLTPEEQKAIKKFISDYFHNSNEGHRKFNRMFDDIAQTPGGFASLCTAMKEEIPEAAADIRRYEEWVKNYLYSEMKDSSKLELLQENEDVAVRFIPTSLTEDGGLPIDNMWQLVNSIIGEHKDEERVDLYVALNNDDLTDNFVLLNVLDIIRVMPYTNVQVHEIMTTTSVSGELVGEIRDDTRVYGIMELVSATRTFLQYGRADMIVDFWERTGAHNEKVENMIYAMRRIDMGISLCNISEIENGIWELRDLFSAGIDLGGDDYYSKLYNVVAEAIARDYGPLLKGDEIGFIELVKWANSKRFYQQTLTLIEARAPRAMVNNGIYYYCDDEAKKEQVTRCFAEFRNTLKPYELYLMDDIEHYYIKMHGRRVHKKKGRDNQRSFANFRMADLDMDREDRVTAHTLSEDRETLGDLLYAYYHIGDVRNKTNHAEETDDDNRLIVDQKDIPLRMTQIRESIDFFIMNYDKIMKEIGDKEKNVVKISSFDVRSMARRLEDDRPAGEKREYGEKRGGYGEKHEHSEKHGEGGEKHE